MKKLLLSPLFLLLISISVLAVTDYSYDATFNTDFIGTSDKSFFNTGIDEDDVVYYSYGLNPYTDEKYDEIPLGEIVIEDIDNDGANEIITTDQKYIYILNASGGLFYTEGIYEIPDLDTSNYATISNINVLDIDDDGYKNIVFSYKSLSSINITVLKLNNNVLTVNTYPSNISFSSGTISAKNYLSCDESTDKCLIMLEGSQTLLGGVYYENIGYYEGGDSLIYVSHLNTAIKTATTTEYAFPKVMYPLIEDIDNDGTNEYHLSEVSVISNTVYYDIGRLKVFGKTFITDKRFNVYSTSTSQFSGTQITGNNIFHMIGDKYITAGNLFTMPVIMDYVIGGSKEYAIGFINDYNDLADDCQSTYKIYTFNSNGNFIDDHPEIDEGEGFILSNIAETNIFKGTTISGCLVSFATILNQSEVMCFTENGQETTETLSYYFDSPFTATDMCYSSDANTYLTGSALNTVIYSGEAESALRSNANKNVDEIISTYGTISISGTTFLGTGIGNIIYNSPYENAYLYPYDYFNTGHLNYFYKTGTNLYLVTDGYRNIGCDEQDCFLTITINPSTKSTWLINTTLQVTIKTQEIDNDNVRGEVYLYYGDDNEQYSNSSFAVVGTTLIFSNLKVNKSIDNGILRLEVEEDINTGKKGVLELPFSVSETYGIVFGESIETIGFDAPTEEEEEDLEVLDSDDALTETVKKGAEYFKLSKYLFGFILMIIVSVVITSILIESFKLKPSVDGTLLIFSGTAFCISFIFTNLNLISSSIFIVMIILILFFIALTLAKVFNKNANGG